MLWSLEIQNMFYGLKLMWGPSYIPFLRLWESIHFLPSPASTVFPHFLAYGHILPNSIVITSLILTLLPLSYEDTCNDVVSTWMIQGDLSMNILNPIFKISPAMKSNIFRNVGLSMDIFVGPLFCLPELSFKIFESHYGSKTQRTGMLLCCL